MVGISGSFSLTKPHNVNSWSSSPSRPQQGSLSLELNHCRPTIRKSNHWTAISPMELPTKPGVQAHLFSAWRISHLRHGIYERSYGLFPSKSEWNDDHGDDELRHLLGLQFFTTQMKKRGLIQQDIRNWNMSWACNSQHSLREERLTRGVLVGMVTETEPSPAADGPDPIPYPLQSLSSTSCCAELPVRSFEIMPPRTLGPLTHSGIWGDTISQIDLSPLDNRLPPYPWSVTKGFNPYSTSGRSGRTQAVHMPASFDEIRHWWSLPFLPSTSKAEDSETAQGRITVVGSTPPDQDHRENRPIQSSESEEYLLNLAMSPQLLDLEPDSTSAVTIQRDHIESLFLPPRQATPLPGTGYTASFCATHGIFLCHECLPAMPMSLASDRFPSGSASGKSFDSFEPIPPSVNNSFLSLSKSLKNLSLVTHSDEGGPTAPPPTSLPQPNSRLITHSPRFGVRQDQLRSSVASRLTRSVIACTTAATPPATGYSSLLTRPVKGHSGSNVLPRPVARYSSSQTRRGLPVASSNRIPYRPNLYSQASRQPCDQAILVPPRQMTSPRFTTHTGLKPSNAAPGRSPSISEDSDQFLQAQVPLIRSGVTTASSASLHHLQETRSSHAQACVVTPLSSRLSAATLHRPQPITIAKPLNQFIRPEVSRSPVPICSFMSSTPHSVQPVPGWLAGAPISSSFFQENSPVPSPGKSRAIVGATTSAADQVTPAVAAVASSSRSSAIAPKAPLPSATSPVIECGGASSSAEAQATPAAAPSPVVAVSSSSESAAAPRYTTPSISCSRYTIPAHRTESSNDRYARRVRGKTDEEGLHVISSRQRAIKMFNQKKQMIARHHWKLGNQAMTNENIIRCMRMLVKHHYTIMEQISTLGNDVQHQGLALSLMRTHFHMISSSREVLNRFQDLSMPFMVSVEKERVQRDLQRLQFGL